MAVARRRWSGFRRTSVRRRRQGAWTGIGPVTLSLTNNVTTYLYLWSDLTSQRLNMSGKGVHQRTILNFGLVPELVGTLSVLAWSLAVYPTDNTNDVPATLVLHPYTQWSSLAEKQPMDMGFRMMTASSGTGREPWSLQGNLQRDIKVKRRMDDTDALILAIQPSIVQGTDPAIPQRVQFTSRTYVSW